jgi:phosphoribosylpyrophosphate synthetase
MWPPNHDYHTFNVTDFVASASGCDGDLTSSVVIASVSSDEPEDNLLGADGATLNDIVIAPDCKSVQLRSERDGDLNGRVYTITFKVRDSQGNTTTATAMVTVTVNQSGPAAVDDGPGAGYTVISACP